MAAKNWNLWTRGARQILEDFYATVRKKEAEDYKPDSLRIMLAATDRYLKEQGYKHSIIYRFSQG